MHTRKIISLILSAAMVFGMCACSNNSDQSGTNVKETETYDKEYIEQTLNLANNADQEWTYNENADAWVLSVVSAVAYPELPDQQGVSVCVPGTYVKGIDTNGDGTADATSGTVKGSLVIDYEAEITSTNGQVYTAATAPVILNTGAAGYGSQSNQTASTGHAADGYINVSCGNRGKQDTATDDSGNTYYGKYVDGAISITKPSATGQAANTDGNKSNGTDISSWVSLENGKVSFSLADAAAYRTAGASKAMPGFDVIDYGQEDYVFGSSEKDARHWNKYLLDIFEEYADTLSPLFNSGK